jgi:hypothetical protein
MNNRSGRGADDTLLVSFLAARLIFKRLSRPCGHVGVGMTLMMGCLYPPGALAAEPEPRRATTIAADQGAPAPKTVRRKKSRKRKRRSHPAPSGPVVHPPSEPSPSRAPDPSAEVPDEVEAEKDSSVSTSRVTRGAQERPIEPVDADEGRGTFAEAECGPSDKACSAEKASPWIAGGELDLDSRYLWRGLPLSRGPVFQPSAWISIFGFTAAVWSNVLLRDEPPSRRISSVVPSLSYAYVFRRLRLEPGIALFWSRDDLPQVTTVEASAKVSLGIGSFRLQTAHHVDVQAHPGAYFGSFGPQYEPTFGRLGLRIFVNVGWATAAFNCAYWDVDQAAFDVVEGGVELRYALSAVLYASAHAEASTLLAPVLRSEADEPTVGNAGVTLGAEW